MTGDAILWDRREESFAQLIARHVPPKEARYQAGYPKAGKWNLRKLMNEPRIKARIDFLVGSAAKRAILSRSDVLEGVREEWRLARLAGQHSAALKAAEMYGGEMHGMFRKQLEVGRPGEFDGMSEEDLRKFVLTTAKELGLEFPSVIDQSPKLIDIQPDRDSSSPSPDTAA